jgi:hypothetical protein
MFTRTPHSPASRHRYSKNHALSQIWLYSERKANLCPPVEQTKRLGAIKATGAVNGCPDPRKDGGTKKVGMAIA